MFNLGMGEITVILLLALIFLGPKKLPELASGLGKLIREIRKTTADVKNEIQLDEAIRKPFEELRDAVTLHPEELKRRDRLKKELADLQREAEAAVAAAEANASQSPEEAPALTTAGTSDSASPSSSDADNATAHETATTAALTAATQLPLSESAPHVGASTPAAAPAAAQSVADPNAGVTTPLPVVAVPTIPGAAPTGTVARTPTGPHSTPPAPPLAAVLAKGSATDATIPPTGDKIADRKVVQPPSGSEFARVLRAVPDGKRLLPRKSALAAPAVDSAADRGNTTQALTEADLAAITVGPPPPPPAPGQTARHLPPPPPAGPLPGATPPKDANKITNKNTES